MFAKEGNYCFGTEMKRSLSAKIRTNFAYGNQIGGTE
jgi:hypothetical protein